MNLLIVNKSAKKMNPDDCIEIAANVQGRVQGVGFRATVFQVAKRLGLLGTVRNLPDGSVEIYLFGPRKIIDRFFQQLKENSGIAKVTNISSKEISPPRSYDFFEIID